MSTVRAPHLAPSSSLSSTVADISSIPGVSKSSMSARDARAGSNSATRQTAAAESAIKSFTQLERASNADTASPPFCSAECTARE